ncbi:MAG: PAS domain-containing protein [Alphaproteobacteria bacterium]|nr:PAS domain-containing protein [Alphaproteobacteria bacterium]
MTEIALILLAALLAFIGGVMLVRALLRGLVADGKLPKWLPAKAADFLFGEVTQHMADGRRLKPENDRLRKEIRHFSTLLNLAPFPLWRRDANDQVVYCNLAYNALLEEVPERILEEFGLELGQNSQKLAARARAEGQMVTDELHIVVEGERKLFQLCEIPDPDHKGTVGFAIDVSGEERVEEELRRHIAAHATLMEASNMATAIYDADKKLKFFNNAYVSLWKFDRQWLNAKPDFFEVLEYLREKRRLPEIINFPLFKQQRAKLFTDLMDQHEEILHLPDGKIVRMVILPYALGGLIFFYEDVTDRLALERSYNTLIAVQRETLNNLHEGVAVYGEDGRMKLSNPTYQKMWGLSADFLASEPHLSEILEACRSYYGYISDWEEFKERTIAAVIHARRMYYQREERSDGTVVDYNTVPLPDGATLITFSDVTDTTLVERSLIEKNEALREADRLKTEFLLSVSYELRSPLTSITGFSEILKERYFGELNEKQSEYLNAIHDSARQLGQLINNILDLASIEAGYMRLDVNEFAIRDLLESVEKEVHGRAAAGGQTFTLQVQDDLGQMQGDENRLRQILLNLVSNALKFTPQGGSITVGASRQIGGDAVRLWVSDDGPGIPLNEQASIFERFRAGALRNQRAGAGLGLAMVKNFVELHHGRIELDSDVGKGTTVTCILPRVQQAKGTLTASGSPLALTENGQRRRRNETIQ